MKIYVLEALIFLNHCQSLEILFKHHLQMIYLLQILLGQMQLFQWET